MIRYLAWTLSGLAVGILVHAIWPAGQAIWVWPVVGAVIGASRAYWAGKRKEQAAAPGTRHSYKK